MKDVLGKAKSKELSLKFDSVKHKFQTILESSGAHEKFKLTLRNTQKPEIFLKAYEMAMDRAYGKSIQINENYNNEIEQRPRLDELVNATHLLDFKASNDTSTSIGDNQPRNSVDTPQ